MNQKFKPPTKERFIPVLVFAAILSLTAGGCFFLGFPERVIWAAMLLVGCGIVCIAAVFSIFYLAKKNREASARQLKEIENAQRSSPATAILASWLYHITEWNEFLKWGRRQKTSTTTLEAVGAFFISFMLTSFVLRSALLFSLLGSIVFAIVYVVSKNFLMTAFVKSDYGSRPEIILTPESVLINGHLTRFQGENLWLEKVDITETKNLNILILLYSWEGAQGRQSREIRLPVPKGKLREAILAQETLSKQIAERGIESAK